MSLILDIPRLAKHRDTSVRRPHEAGNREAVVTGDGRLLVRRTHRFHGNHRLETRPFRQLRKGWDVCYGPNPSPHRAAVCVIAGIKEMLGVTLGQMVFDGLMKVLCDRRVGLFGVALQVQEIVASLVQDLVSDSF